MVCINKYYIKAKDEEGKTVEIEVEGRLVITKPSEVFCEYLGEYIVCDSSCSDCYIAKEANETPH